MLMKIISEDGQKLTVEVTVDISGSMLEAEEKIMVACNALGSLSTEKALSQFDTDGTPIRMGEKKYTAKNRENKEYQTPYGAVQIKRHVYQTSSGGKIYVPLEMGAQIIHNATPKFGKILSHKYASMSAKDVLDDLSMNHGREISKRYLQGVSGAICAIMEDKEDVWEYALPSIKAPIEIITLSMDGAMLPTCDDGWRESMVGTISLFDAQGERQHTIYVGEPPEYGKSNFMNRFTKEIEKIKINYPQVLCIGM